MSTIRYQKLGRIGYAGAFQLQRELVEKRLAGAIDDIILLLEHPPVITQVLRGLGSRHIAAAGITSLTKSIAFVISESSGDVRIFKDGKIIMHIEKS